MARVRKGDAIAFECILQRYWHRLVEYALILTEDLDSAEDIVQETFVRVWEKRERWRPTGSVGAYLYVITRNLALQARERRLVESRWRQTESQEVSDLAPHLDDHEAFELNEILTRAIEALPQRRRETLILVRFHEMTYRQAAEVMNVSPQTVANQLSAAMSELRRVVSRTVA